MRKGRSRRRRWFLRASAAGTLGFAGCAGGRDRGTPTATGTTASPTTVATSRTEASTTVTTVADHFVDVKAGVRDVTIEYRTDADGSGCYVLARHAATSEQAVALRGRNCTLRGCVLADGHCAGVEIASESLAEGEAPAELAAAGTDNAVYGNHIVGNAARAVRFGRSNEDGEPYVPERYGPSAQRAVCGNEYDGTTDADPDAPCPDRVPAGDGIGHTGGVSPWDEE